MSGNTGLPALPGESHRYSFSSEPPPPPTRGTAPTPGDETPPLTPYPDDASDDETPPPPPFSQILRAHSGSQSKHGPSPSSSPPPPPAERHDIPPHPHADEEDDAVPFDFDTALSDDDDDGDDSDLDEETRRSGGGRGRGLGVSLGTSLSPGDDVLSPLQQKKKSTSSLKQQERNSKLSFTAPSETSPLAASTAFQTPSINRNGPLPGSTTSATALSPKNAEGVSLSSLSSQLSLHMELQSFAAQRKKSIILTGAAANSLIPQSVGISPQRPANIPAATSNASTSVVPSLANVRRTHNIRSMSLSLASGSSLFPGRSPHAFGVPRGAAGDQSAVIPGLAVSPAFAALTAATNPAALMQQRPGRRKSKHRPPEPVLDLFGDGAEAIAQAGSHGSSSRPGVNKRKSIFASSMPAIVEASAAGGEFEVGSVKQSHGGGSGSSFPPSSHPAPLPLSMLEEDPFSSLGSHDPDACAGTTATPSEASSLAGSQRGSIVASSVNSASGRESSRVSFSATTNSSSTAISRNSQIPPPPPLTSVSQQISPKSAGSELSIPPPPPPAVAPLLSQSDDLTSTFIPPSQAHISCSFPARKILRAPVRTTGILNDVDTASMTPAALQRQEELLTFILDTLRTNKQEFRLYCIENLRKENQSLQELIQKLKTEQNSSAPTVQSGKINESLLRDQTKRTLSTVAQHASWNTELHTTTMHLQLQLEDLRRRVQLHLPEVPSSVVKGEGEDVIAAQANGTMVPGGNKRASVASNNPSNRPIVSLAEIASKARSIAPAQSSSTANQQGFGSARELLSPTPATGGIGGEYSSLPLTNTTSTTPQAQLQRFTIIKINRIRKNTPRILEIDLTTKTMTICKKVSSSSKSSKDLNAGGDDEFQNRDIVISPGLLVSGEMHPSKETQFELSFIVYNTHAGNAMGPANTFSSASNLLSPSAGQGSPVLGSKSLSSPPPDKSGKSVKNWKVLFATKTERERFYRLLQVTLLTPESSSNSGGSGSASNQSQSHPAGANGYSAHGHSASRLGGGQDSMHSHHASHHDNNSGPLSTTYPAVQPNGQTIPTLYTPRIPSLTSSILSSVRLLPLLPLASSLHTIWCLNKKKEGWKYGLKLSNGTTLDPSRKTHPYLIPFHSLPLQRRDYNLKVVTATLATVLALGFHIRKTFSGEDTVLDARAKEKQSQQVSGGGGAGTLLPNSLASGGPNSAAPSQPLGHISPDLLALVDFFAESSHDLWSEDKLQSGWRYGSVKSLDSKTHPGLVPFSLLPPQWQEKERHQSYKILVTLVEWGYELVKADAPSSSAGHSSAASNSSQPSAGSLKRLPSSGTMGAGIVTQGSTSRLISTQTFAQPTG